MKFFQKLFNSQESSQKIRVVVNLQLIVNKKEASTTELNGLFNFSSFRQNQGALKQKQLKSNILAISNLYTNRQSFSSNIQKHKFQSEKYEINKDCELFIVKDKQNSKKQKQVTKKIVLVSNQKDYQKKQSKCIGKIKFKSNQKEQQTPILFQSITNNIQAYIILQKIKYALSINDIIKFGRKKYEIVAMYDGLQFLSNKSKLSDISSLYSFDKESKIAQINSQAKFCDSVDDKSKKTCKFCLMTSQELKTHEQIYINGIDGSLLISPCKCKGSCSVVHISCLKTWLNTKIKKIDNQNFQYYDFSNLICQICKDDIPRSIQMQQHSLNCFNITKEKNNQFPKTQRRRGQNTSRSIMKNVSLVDVDIFQTQKSHKNLPFLVLKGIQCQTNKQKQLIKIKFSTKNKLIIGRNGDSDIILNDVSISRQHSVISFMPQTKGFYLKDNDSKYGTLIKARQSLNLMDFKYGLKLQIQKDIVKFQVNNQNLNKNVQRKQNNTNIQKKLKKEKENKQNLNNLFSFF